MTFGALPPFAHFGVPVMSIMTRRLCDPDWPTSSSRSPRRYAGSLPFRALLGRRIAIWGHDAVVWMTDAPALLACWRLFARAAAQRKVASSKKPIGIFCAAWTVAAGA